MGENIHLQKYRTLSRLEKKRRISFYAGLKQNSFQTPEEKKDYSSELFTDSRRTEESPSTRKHSFNKTPSKSDYAASQFCGAFL